ncbi:MAG: pilus assembly protein PilM [Deltaproteobacteria bacterium]
MSVLGIYFGLKAINIVETKGKKILNSIAIPRAAFSGGEMEEKVPDELKIVALTKDEMRRAGIEAKEAVLCLSGKDLIIRTFEMPLLPQDELPNAVNFEVKKYIPFKVEELISDFQVQLDKVSRRNLVLYVGTKKEVLDKYLAILAQLNIKVSAVEYSAFSILRFIQLAGVANKGIVAVISTDFQEEEEVHFTILENGFPLFSRDITLLGRPEELGAAEKIEPAVLLEKLKTEIRISLDYYDRKLPTKNIENTFLICADEYRSPLEAAIKDMGLPVNFIETKRYIDKSAPFNLSLIKSYGSSLLKVIKTRIKVDLLSIKARSRLTKEAAAAQEGASILSGVKVSPFAVVLGLFIFIGTYVYGQYRIAPLKKEMSDLLNMRPKVTTVNPDSTYEELEGSDLEYKKKMQAMDNIVKQQMYVTEELDAIPRLVPDGIWMTDFSLRKDDNILELNIKGLAYAENSDKELKLVNTFLSNIKESPLFSKDFKEMTISSIDRIQLENFSATSFVVICRSYYKDKGR